VRTKRERGSSNADVCTFLCKNFGFFLLCSVSAQTKRVSQCEPFVDKEGVNFFAILCGRLLDVA